MDYKNFIIIILIILVPLILMILCYRNYVYQYCQNDMKCMKNRLLVNLYNFNDKLKNKINSEKNENNIEGFFGGIGSWFSGGSPSNLPISGEGAPINEMSLLEKKISDKPIKSSSFPPKDDDEFKDSDNSDILNIAKNPYTPPKANIPKQEEKKVEIKENKVIPLQSSLGEASISQIQTPAKVPANVPAKAQVPIPSPASSPSFNTLFGKCQFYNDSCPDKYKELGNFSIEGVGSNSILKCGNVENTKPARAVAEIKNKFIYEIHITDAGQGYNPIKPPKITIEGGKGHGATAEAIIDDDGNLKIIKVINPGYNYSETPNIMIDPPFMNSSCHLCCNID